MAPHATPRRVADSGPAVKSGLWYRAALTAEQVAAGHFTIVQRLFAEAIEGAVDARGACLFGVSRDAASPDRDADAAREEDAVYFSPASIALVPHLIAQYGGRPGPPPDRRVASLLAGTDEDWELLPRATH